MQKSIICSSVSLQSIQIQFFSSCSNNVPNTRFLNQLQSLIINSIIQMYYYQYPQKNQQEARIKQLEEDKLELTNAISQLNFCYQEKIAILENTIAQQQEKYEEVLEWKQKHIDKSIFDVERYEVQIKRMIEILDNAHKNFESEKQTIIKEIQEQELTIRELREENAALNDFNTQNESKIEEMVRSYSEQIEKLKQELRDLREESAYSENSSVVALRDITSSQNRENFEPNSMSQIMIKGGPETSKISIHTTME